MLKFVVTLLSFALLSEAAVVLPFYSLKNNKSNYNELYKLKSKNKNLVKSNPKMVFKKVQELLVFSDTDSSNLREPADPCDSGNTVCKSHTTLKLSNSRSCVKNSLRCCYQQTWLHFHLRSLHYYFWYGLQNHFFKQDCSTFLQHVLSTLG